MGATSGRHMAPMISKTIPQRVARTEQSDQMRRIAYLTTGAENDPQAELSYQISAVTALPIGTVMSRLARARRAFGDTWRRCEIDNGG